jgi:L-asparagine transporter-like permease
MAPLQKRAWYGLIIGILWAAVTLVVFITGGGVDEFTKNQSFRILMDALFIGWLIVYMIILRSTLALRKPRKGKVSVDERDMAILNRAPLIQLWTVIISLVVWAISLTEIYWNQGAIPIMYMYIIFFSSLVVSTLAQSAGILIGYWRASRYG